MYFSGAAEMKIAIDSKFFESMSISATLPVDYILEGSNYFVTIPVSRNNTKIIENKNVLELYFCIHGLYSTVQSQGVELVLSNKLDIEFSCFYSLEKRSITTTTGVYSTTNTAGRPAWGVLNYYLDLPSETIAGQKRIFKIVPEKGLTLINSKLKG